MRIPAQILPFFVRLFLMVCLLVSAGCRDDEETFQVVVIDSQEELENLLLGSDGTRINGDVIISGNVLSLEILSSVEKIIGNLAIVDSQITSLEGLDNLNLVTGDITIRSTPPFQQRIVDFCALQNLLTQGSFRSINILDNLHNPSVQDIQSGNCSF